MAPDREQSIGQLVSGAVADVQALVKDQIELTKAEVSKSAKQFGTSARMFVAAATLGLIGFIFLLVTAAYGLNAAGLALWLSFLIVSVVVLIVAAILALLGKQRIDKGRAMTQRAVSSAKTTQAALQADVKRLTGGPDRPTGAATALPPGESTSG